MSEVLQAPASKTAASTPKAAVKRLLDVVLAAGGRLVAGAPILLGALAVKLTPRGRAFYRAKRAGLGGKPFLMFKLRTMRIGSDSADRKVTADQDARATVGGRW